MQVPVGNLSYHVTLSKVRPALDGALCDGLCDIDNMLIIIWAGLPVPRRIATFWHEYMHAIKADLDIYRNHQLPEEAMCNLLGSAMIGWPEHLFLSLLTYLRTGIDAADVLCYGRNYSTVPVFKITGD